MKTLKGRIELLSGTPSPTGCIPWLGARLRAGYGTLQHGGRKLLAHRAAWEVARGRIPDGLMVRHVKCRTPSCVNVEHLALGTHRDNVDDRTRDSVALRGTAMPGAKLTEADVREIRASGESQRALARRYGVSQPAINHIRQRTTWAHVK